MFEQPKRDIPASILERRAWSRNHSPSSVDAITDDLNAYRRQRRDRMSTERRRARHQELTGATPDLIRFAQKWAPYGGAPAEEIFVRYGMTTERFLCVLADATSSPDCDPLIATTLRSTYFLCPSDNLNGANPED
ncbi:hypothetical protein [Rhodococcus opacus]|uniref:hypothetical protein n=1 Tax=Rhodococcus opacus TaxID=37919 RepID=UPI001009A268|nr:hypothetical protein [Rhodococcus opacus]